MDRIVSDQSNTTRQKQKSVVGDVVLALVCLLPVFYAVVVFFKQPLRYVELIAEDNIGETFTAVCFLGAGVIALATHIAVDTTASLGSCWHCSVWQRSSLAVKRSVGSAACLVTACRR